MAFNRKRQNKPKAKTNKSDQQASKKSSNFKSQKKSHPKPLSKTYKGKRQKQRQRSPQNQKQSKYNRPKQQKLAPEDRGKLKIAVIGGNEEVGRNMTMIEYENDIIIIDMGLQFPEEDMPGIDYIIPNTEYLERNKHKIRGVIITHGHYDHIGGIPHIMGKIGNPTLYATDLTLGIIKKRQDDFMESPQLKTGVIKNNTKLKLGVFRLEFIHISHNIPASVGVIVNTPLGIVLHTGDFKLDKNPVGDTPPDFGKIKKLARRKVIAMLSDSTNASQAGQQLTESQIGTDLEEIFRTTKSRMIVGTFASNLSRIQQLIWLAEKYGRKVAVEGFSMKTNVEISKKMGYLKVKKFTFIDSKELDKYPDNKVMVICTGAQGEGGAQLMRIANREHRSIRLKKGDTVVFSSSVIPGNERSVQRLTDSLYRAGAKVINYRMMDIHAGGHAKQEDLKAMLNMVKPKYLVPIEGNHSFLHHHAEAAMEAGFSEKNIFIADNGQIMEFTRKGGRLTDKKIPSDYVFVDGLGVGDISNIVLRDRKVMSEDGMIVIIATIETKTGRIIGNPDIISRGFVYMKENKELIEATRRKAKKILIDRDPKIGANSADIKNKIRNDIGQFLFQRTERRPMVLPVVIEV